jgi:hypothetical protein
VTADTDAVAAAAAALEAVLAFAGCAAAMLTADDEVFVKPSRDLGVRVDICTLLLTSTHKRDRSEGPPCKLEREMGGGGELDVDSEIKPTVGVWLGKKDDLDQEERDRGGGRDPGRKGQARPAEKDRTTI